VAAYQANRDRRLVQLGERQTPLDDSLPPDISEAIRALPGQWIYMPGATQSGLLLPLKLGTLFGRPRYFHAADPREP
jgi:hypothetical protein